MVGTENWLRLAPKEVENPSADLLCIPLRASYERPLAVGGMVLREEGFALGVELWKSRYERSLFDPER